MGPIKGSMGRLLGASNVTWLTGHWIHQRSALECITTTLIFVGRVHTAPVSLELNCLPSSEIALLAARWADVQAQVWIVDIARRPDRLGQIQEHDDGGVPQFLHQEQGLHSEFCSLMIIFGEGVPSGD